jgi:Cytochrome c7 and related cytochrome c
LLLALSAPPAVAQSFFSPGDLTTQHEKFEGLSNCLKCHPSGKQLSQESCLAPCHTELQPRIAAGKGLHGRLAGEQRNCQLCHREHQGRTAPLVDWGVPGGKKAFDHRRTGWALKGEHFKVECQKCHERRLITWPVAVKLLEVRQTLLGADQACESCHFDEHRGQQKEDCEYCHNEKAWKPAPGFDHSTTQYPLKGKHAKVKCDKCHPGVKDDVKHGFPAPKSETYLKFTGLEFGQCTDCHKDPHENRFGPRCVSCHTVDGWSIIRSASKEREFHEKTRFPLKGAHLEVECRACHGPFAGQPAKFKGLKYEECTDCHPDAHQAQLSGASKVQPECTACHSVDAFSPVKYGLAEHAKTRYALEGAHMVVACDACHEQTPALQRKVNPVALGELRRKKRKELFSLALFTFTKPLDRCDTCHTDVHKGQFGEKACSGCHLLASFEKLKFDHQRDSRYPLTGKHGKVACEKCHFVSPGSKDSVNGKPVVRYRPLDQKCSSCHPDIHLGQFARRGELAECERCHATDDWKRLKFTHAPPFTTYLLEGQHAQVKCEGCHQQVLVEGKADGKPLRPVRYRPLPRACEGCHADFHKGAFQGFEP